MMFNITPLVFMLLMMFSETSLNIINDIKTKGGILKVIVTSTTFYEMFILIIYKKGVLKHIIVKDLRTLQSLKNGKVWYNVGLGRKFSLHNIIGMKRMHNQCSTPPPLNYT